MQKKLIALAMASAFAAPAFAATSNVDVYGILNVGINYINDGDALNGDKNISVTSNASRLGFKGSEDLGSGLAAIWQIESGFNADETSGTIGSRNTFVGLKGGFGTIVAGKHDTPMKTLGRKLDNFADTMADSRNILGAVGDYYGENWFDLRTPNTIGYISPNFNGLSVFAAYVTSWDASGTNAIDDNKMDAFSLNATYENGPLMVGAAYEKHNDYSFSENMWRLAASYAFGNAKVGATYEKLKSDDKAAEHSSYGIFGNYTMGNTTLKANYLKAGSNKSYGNSDANQYTIGADYALSKRTTAYALYAKLNNNDSGYGMGIGGGTSDRIDTNNIQNWGDDFSVFGIGVKHSF